MEGGAYLDWECLAGYNAKPFARTSRMDLAMRRKGKWVLRDPNVNTMNKSSFFAFISNVDFF